MSKFKVLSIDAWADSEPFSWTWNQWYTVGSIEKIPPTDSEIVQWFIDEGYLKETAKDKVYVVDDGYNLVITVLKDDCPLWAIEYGNKGDL